MQRTAARRDIFLQQTDPIFKCLWFDLHSMYRDVCVGSSADLSEHESISISIEGEIIGEGYHYRITYCSFGEHLHSFELSVDREFDHHIFGRLKAAVMDKRKSDLSVYPIKLECGLHALNFEDQIGVGSFVFAEQLWRPERTEAIEDIIMANFSHAVMKDEAEATNHHLESAVEAVFVRSEAFFIQLKRHLARKRLTISSDELHRCLSRLLEELFWVLDKLRPHLSAGTRLERVHHLIEQLLSKDVSILTAESLIHQFDSLAQKKAIVIAVQEWLKTIDTVILRQIVFDERKITAFNPVYNSDQSVGVWRLEKLDRMTYLDMINRTFKKELSSKLYAAVDIKTRRVILQASEIDVLAEHSERYMSITSRGISVVNKSSLQQESTFPFSVVDAVPITIGDSLFVLVDSDNRRGEKMSVLDVDMSSLRNGGQPSCYRVWSLKESRGSIEFLFGSHHRIGALVNINSNVEQVLLFSKEKDCGKLLKEEVMHSFEEMVNKIRAKKSDNWRGHQIASTPHQIIDVWMIQQDDLLLLSTFNTEEATFMALMLVSFSVKGDYRSEIAGDLFPIMRPSYSHLSYSSFLYHRGKTCLFVFDKQAGLYQLFTFQNNKILTTKRYRLSNFTPTKTLMMTRTSNSSKIYISSSDECRLKLIELKLQA